MCAIWIIIAAVTGSLVRIGFDVAGVQGHIISGKSKLAKASRMFLPRGFFVHYATHQQNCFWHCGSDRITRSEPSGMLISRKQNYSTLTVVSTRLNGFNSVVYPVRSALTRTVRSGRSLVYSECQTNRIRYLDCWRWTKVLDYKSPVIAHGISGNLHWNAWFNYAIHSNPRTLNQSEGIGGELIRSLRGVRCFDLSRGLFLQLSNAVRKLSPVFDQGLSGGFSISSGERHPSSGNFGGLVRGVSGTNHFSPLPDGDCGVESGSNECQPSSNNKPPLKAIIAIIASAALSLYCFWNLQFGSHDWRVLLLALLLCFVGIMYGSYKLLEFSAQQAQFSDDSISEGYEPLSYEVHKNNLAVTGTLIGIVVFRQESKALGVYDISKIRPSIWLESIAILDQDATQTSISRDFTVMCFLSRSERSLLRGTLRVIGLCLGRRLKVSFWE